MLCQDAHQRLVGYGELPADLPPSYSKLLKRSDALSEFCIPLRQFGLALNPVVARDLSA